MPGIELDGVSRTAYNRLMELVPESIDWKIKDVLDVRARFCASCMNFSKLNLFCSKCGCVEQDPNKFAKQKFLDLSYHCPQKYW